MGQKMKRLVVVALFTLSFIMNSPCRATPPRPVFMGEAVRFAAVLQLTPEQNRLPASNILRMKSVAVEMTRLGFEQAKRGEWNLAERSFLAALHIDELIEPRSRKVATDLSNLIGVYLAQDKYTLAEPLIERFLRDFQKDSLSEEVKQETVEDSQHQSSENTVNISPRRPRCRLPQSRSDGCQSR